MTERELQEIETALGDAGPNEAAAIAFAAICQIGQHGREAGEAFALLANGADNDPDMGINWCEGCSQIEDHLAR